jgi:hypothetical protein
MVKYIKHFIGAFKGRSRLALSSTDEAGGTFGCVALLFQASRIILYDCLPVISLNPRRMSGPALILK